MLRTEVYADEVGFAQDPHFNDESKLITITIIVNLILFNLVNIGKWPWVLKVSAVNYSRI